MSLSIDLTTHGRALQQVYDKIISGSADTSWAVFSYDRGASNELKVQSEGSGELDEIVDEFSDGRISYGFVRVEDPNTKLNKFVLIGWCGEGVPEYKKGLFHSHFVAVSKFLKGYHVQITARSEADLDPATIMNKVADSSGSKYSQIMSKFETSPQSRRGPPISPSVSAAFGRSPGYKKPEVKKDDDGWGDAPQITKSAPSYVKSAYQPTKVDMAALRAGKSDTTSSTPTAPEIVKSTYTPIGRVDIAALRAQAQQQQPEPKSESSYVGTSGYQPVQLSKPKPIASRFGPTVSRGGTIAPMPAAPARESKAIGGASKNFAADASGKTPSQLWAERKAREKGFRVTPDVTPQRPLPTMRQDISPPIGQVDDSADVTGKPVSGGVAAMKERFARQSLDDEQPALPISPGPVRPVARSPPAMRVNPPSVPSPPAAPSPTGPPSPPPVSMSSKPPARTYQSLDDVVAAGAGAGIGLGVGAMASQALHHEEPEEEEYEHGEREQVGYSPVETRTPATWDRTQPTHESEDEEDVLARQRAQVHEEQEHEPQEHAHEEQQYEQSSHTAQGSKTAVVLFDYEAQEENEINLIEGQIITNIEFIDDGWWAGDDPSGQNGLFPSNYVELQEHETSEDPAVPQSPPQPHTEEPHHVEAEEGADLGETAIAEYDYEAQEDNELGFPEGALITNIERVDENWWGGEYDGKAGLFPSNYVKVQ